MSILFWPNILAGTSSPATEALLKSTDQIIKNKNLAKKVNELAARNRVESSHIGYAGRPSHTYSLFMEVVKHSSKDEIIQLAFHRSPIVRAYIVAYAVQHDLGSMNRLAPLAYDGTGFDTMDGCVIGRSRVNAQSLEAIRRELDSPDKAVRLQVASSVDILQAPEAFHIRKRLFLDSDDMVRSTAMISYFEHPQRDYEKVRQLLHDADLKVVVAEHIRKWNTKQSHAMLKELHLE